MNRPKLFIVRGFRMTEDLALGLQSIAESSGYPSVNALVNTVLEGYLFSHRASGAAALMAGSTKFHRAIAAAIQRYELAIQDGRLDVQDKVRVLEPIAKAQAIVMRGEAA